MKVIIELDTEKYSEKDIENCMKGIYLASKIDTVYDQCFRHHLKYDKPIIGNKLTARDKEILERLLLNINYHFGDKDEDL